MSPMTDIHDGIAAHVASLGLELDHLALTGAGRGRVLEVVLDADSGVDLDQIATASQSISAYLDASGLMGEQPYVLEVSSRGVDRPLTTAAHWRRNVGRLVNVTGQGISATGRIVRFEDPDVTLQVKGQERVIDIHAIDRAVVEVEFTAKEPR